MKTVLDVETSIFKKGNPFSKNGQLVCVGLLPITGTSDIWWNAFNELIVPNYLIGFNIKFDLHWLRRAGLELPVNLTVWDCQLAHFILTGQTHPYPSLDEVAAYYGLDQKLSMVKEDYWEKGIDTQDIPPEVLETYLKQDLHLTLAVYHKQIEHFKTVDRNQYRLFLLHCKDLLVLEEMEYNGMLFDTKAAAEILVKEEGEIKEIENTLQSYFPDVPINWDSRDHISCCLYGGSIILEDRVPIGVYKTGAKAGQTRYKLVETKYEIPQMVKPIKGSELKKPGYWATDEPTLRSLAGPKRTKTFLHALLQRAEKSKLCNTYYRGIPELITEMDWPDGRIHGQFNQCVAATGRLSSSKPNLQNFAGEVDQLLISRYDD